MSESKGIYALYLRQQNDVPRDIDSPAAEGHEKYGVDDERGSARGDGAIEDKRAQ